MNIRRSLAIITAVILGAFYAAGAAVAAVVYNPAPVPPMPSVMGVSAEPDYLVAIGWDRIVNAYAYELEYKYDFEPTKTGKVSTAKTSFKIERIKGNLHFRMRTIYSNGNKFSKFSDWTTYYVNPLYLPPAKPVSLYKYQQGVKFIRSEWETVSYLYKGKYNYVNYYDCIAVGPGMDKDVELEIQHNIRTIYSGDIATTYFFNLTSGDWTIYYRPSICSAVLQNEKIYSDNLLKIYDETDAWTSSGITVS